MGQGDSFRSSGPQGVQGSQEMCLEPFLLHHQREYPLAPLRLQGPPINSPASNRDGSSSSSSSRSRSKQHYSLGYVKRCPSPPMPSWCCLTVAESTGPTASVTVCVNLLKQSTVCSSRLLTLKISEPMVVNTAAAGNFSSSAGARCLLNRPPWAQRSGTCCKTCAAGQPAGSKQGP